MEFTTNSTGPESLYQLAAIYFAVKAPLAASVDIGSKVPVGRKNGYGIICGASTNARGGGVRQTEVTNAPELACMHVTSKRVQ